MIELENVSLQNLIDFLEKTGVKITLTRLILLKTFTDNPDVHFDFNSLLKIVKKEDPNYGVATLYRNLDMLIKKNIISVNTINNVKYYEIITPQKGNIHTHLICKYCNNVEEYSGYEVIQFLNLIKDKYGFDINYGSINVYGICKKCREKLKE
ncbi:Fur family transcriptional regulator [Thermoanaerobacterium thermosulfurigenes]|uniref:Fur family transcriptional regulator n=1 Tax=Thermoanaerobacterium thermosulfurigenes TaxID=33950 RepID=UPI003F4A1396